MKRLALLLFFLTAAACVRAAEPNVYFAYRSFWPEHETMKRFAAVGVHTFCVFPSNTENSLGEPYSKYPRIWRYPDTYDWDSLYRLFDEIIAFDPDAEFLCMVDLNSPIWLARMLGMNGDGSFDSFIDLSSCLSSPEWRRQTEKYLADFLAQTEERYGDRIKAYILACGQTDEWMDYSAERTSRAKTAAYKRWTEANGLEPLAWPDFAAFDSAAFENRVRDPQKEKPVLQATQFEQELIADSILSFAKLAKEKTGRAKEIGVFFGYILELTHWRANGCGHLAYEKVAASDDVDIFISPGTYAERLIGGGSGSMAPNETLLLANKRRLHETDHRTTGYNCALNEFVSIAPISRWQSEAEDVAGLRRELCFALTDRASIWFFDMWGGSFTTDAAIENVAVMKRVWDANVGRQGRSAAEVLLVADPQTAARVNGREPKSALVYTAIRNRLDHIGAPFAVCSFNDLPKMDLSNVKLAILPGSFYLPPERAAMLRETLLNGGRTVLWVGPAGIDDGNALDLARVRETTGVEYGADALEPVARVGFFGEGDGRWRSAAIADHAKVDAPALRKIARAAGVTEYVADESPVYATERLVAVHVKTGGPRKITLPKQAKRVTEAFSGKVVAENAKEFEYEFAEPETALFVLE
ncbi:MAG: hypothetical protein II561_11355 [Thermoguttaceae bacterium]|nr:hypothetical protein [Thermoguttaceae bacterium]